MHLAELARRCGLQLSPSAPPGPIEITAITFDSREVQQGTLFVALHGARSDGHDFVRTALDMGAAAVLVEQARVGEFEGLGQPIAFVDGCRERLGAIASEFFGRPSNDLSVVGITGTNGKTTVSYLLEAALSMQDAPTGVIGTVNYRWPGHVEAAPNTTPESLVIQRLLARMRDDGVQHVAMEVSSHGLATHRLESTSFLAGVFTNLSQDHLDFHGSMQEYRDAKRRLFLEYLPRTGGTAILNVDDAEGRALAQLVPTPVVTTSALGREADWSCTSWRQTLDGTTMTVVSPSGSLHFQTRLLGAFNVSNVLQTLATAALLGVEPLDAVNALAPVRGVPGRLQHVGGDGQPHVFVDYAHTPDALERALEALRPLASGRLVVVFGCGGDRDRDKRPLMGSAASKADFVVVTSDNPRTEDPLAIIAQIEPGLSGSEWVTVVDRAEAIQVAIADSAPDDVILIAGKGHETYQEVSGVRRPFDDLDHARLALEQRE